MEASAAAGIAKMVEGYQEFCTARIATLTHPEVLSLLTQMESLTRRLPCQSHRLLARLQREVAPRELGAKGRIVGGTVGTGAGQGGRRPGRRHHRG